MSVIVDRRAQSPAEIGLASPETTADLLRASVRLQAALQEVSLLREYHATLRSQIDELRRVNDELVYSNHVLAKGKTILAEDMMRLERLHSAVVDSKAWRWVTIFRGIMGKGRQLWKR